MLQRAGEFNLTLEDVSITHLTFGKVGSLCSRPPVAQSDSVCLGIHASCRGKADCPARYVSLPAVMVNLELNMLYPDAERAKFIVEKVSLVSSALC